jgi:26S proteasome regulatory subunit N12
MKDSPRERPIRGLQLMRLLTQNRIADFHTALESLPLAGDALAEDPYLSHPVNLERWLMEGSYAKVWAAREEAPTDEYEFFVEELMGTIRCVLHAETARWYSPLIEHRNEIASCEETAYESLPLKDAATLLFFQNQSELLRFAEQVTLPDLQLDAR